jgi:hypothetical protein
VESAVLIGAPTPSDASVWRAIRSVVAGRLVNVYSEKDYVLAFLYRTSSVQFGVTDLEAVDGVKGVENVDASATVSGHLRYPHLVVSILENIEWEDINVQEVEREQLVVKMLDKEEEEKMAERNEMVSAKANALKTQVGSQRVPEKEGHQHPVEMSDDEESHGITMVDNEDEGITMLEPIPWTEDEELRTIESPQPTKRKEDTRQETAHARMQDAFPATVAI